ncbi:MAG: preprotein translocase subunit YajC [Alphaproteobacteria bacterium]|nr:MAG: preprotein translocase subunit YajC [Alphaproteobacteria bacterium]
MDFLGLLPFLLIFVIFYFLIFRPQAQERKEHEQMLASLKVGNSILLNSGIFGKITRIEQNDIIKVEIADGIKVKALRSSVSKLA